MSHNKIMEYNTDLMQLIQKLPEETKDALILVLVTQTEQYLVENPKELITTLIKDTTRVKATRQG